MVTLPYPSWLQKADVNPQLDDEHSRSGPCWKTVFWQCRASHGGTSVRGCGEHPAIVGLRRSWVAPCGVF